MLADRGLILRLPKSLTSPEGKSVYRDIITNWVMEASAIGRSTSSQWSPIQVKRSPYGRIDLLTARNDVRGIVIGAPHGSFDWYTGELVEELSYRTSLAGVVTRGFTPTEYGGWRINVNRPTEHRYPIDIVERATDRAKKVFQHFRESVFEAAQGPLDLYIDMHQNSSEENIDVATLGITHELAKAIKTEYREIRDRVLRNEPKVTKVNLVIEPLDQVARTSLHFELPAQYLFYKASARRAYTTILAELIESITKLPFEIKVVKLVQ